MAENWNNLDRLGGAMHDALCSILRDLTGEVAPFPKNLDTRTNGLLRGSGLGYSQFNELLLLLGYDRVTRSFFQFLLDGGTEYRSGAAFKSLKSVRTGVDRFRELAILNFGNVKFGFKYLSDPTRDLTDELARAGPIEPADFSKRHQPLLPVDPIPGDKTYFLGYLIKRQLDERLLQNPNDSAIKQQLQERRRIVEKGKRNQGAYLASDHMDVYVATSMRESHEYQMVNQVVDEIFNHPKLKKLNLRWFDPTQAFCEERIDKGLVEGLMLKRAACTLYLAQESDTLGKDSELASTLAQGKPVIAYIPSVTPKEQDKYVNDLLKMVARGSPNTDEKSLVLQQLRVFQPDAAWKDKQVIGWVVNRAKMNLADAKRRLGDCIGNHYDSRAKTLKESHPLGIQIHLQTGVANGVLVARTTSQCANLILRILTRTLKFRICEEIIDENRYLLLREQSTDSVFRVVTGDRFLTNAFWNFYTAK
ncbi:MAG: hypothetical protein ABSB42_07560 [Tepidisphaeraceae bacterium]